MSNYEDPKLVILVPTRGRFTEYKRLEGRFLQHRSLSTQLFPIMSYGEHYEGGYEIYPTFPVHLVTIGGNLVEKLNVGADTALEAAKAKYIGWVGDDVVIQTPDFDRLIIEAFEAEPHIKIIHCADLLHNGKIANHWILRADVVEQMGWFIPPTFKHLWIDNFWTKLGTETNTIKYLGHVLLEHRHFVNRKAEMDDTYRLSNNDEAMEYGRKAFEEITSPENWAKLLEKYNSF